MAGCARRRERSPDPAGTALADGLGALEHALDQLLAAPVPPEPVSTAPEAPPPVRPNRPAPLLRKPMIGRADWKLPRVCMVTPKPSTAIGSRRRPRAEVSRRVATPLGVGTFAAALVAAAVTLLSARTADSTLVGAGLAVGASRDLELAPPVQIDLRMRAQPSRSRSAVAAGVTRVDRRKSATSLSSEVPRAEAAFPSADRAPYVDGAPRSASASVAAFRHSARLCVERAQHKAPFSLPSRIDLAIAVGPDGAVQRLEIAPLRSQFLLDCLIEQARALRWPARGEPYRFESPIVLSRAR
jgi:hypothetical protein